MSNAISQSRTPNSQSNYADWEFKLIKLAHEKGLTATELATVMDRTPESIKQKASLRGWKIDLV